MGSSGQNKDRDRVSGTPKQSTGVPQSTLPGVISAVRSSYAVLTKGRIDLSAGARRRLAGEGKGEEGGEGGGEGGEERERRGLEWGLRAVRAQSRRRGMDGLGLMSAPRSPSHFI